MLANVKNPVYREGLKREGFTGSLALAEEVRASWIRVIVTEGIRGKVESNHQPDRYERNALPFELLPLQGRVSYRHADSLLHLASCKNGPRQ